MEALQILLAKLAADPRIERFQGLHVNADGSTLVIHRWGGKLFPSVDSIAAWQESDAVALEPLRPAEVS